MTPEREARLLEFFSSVTTRLILGERTYEDATFDRPLPEIIEELRAEILDQAAYAFIALERLAGVEELARKAEAGPAPVVVIRRPARRLATDSTEAPHVDPTHENATTGQPGASNGQSAISMDNALESKRDRPS
jgi:hypothetical protein